MDRVTEAVRKAIARAPCSTRALAYKAGVDQSLLVRIRAGERAATPQVAAKVATALDTWGKDCAHAAAAIRRATKRRGTP